MAKRNEDTPKSPKKKLEFLDKMTKLSSFFFSSCALYFQEMAIYSYDIVSTLQALGMIKYWKGKHIVLKKQDVLEDYQDRIKRKTPIPRTDSGYLRWVPFVPKQNNLNTN